MAHMNRGSTPVNFSGGGDNDSIDTFRESAMHHHHHIYFYDPMYYYMQIIFLIVVFVSFGLMYIFMYKPSFTDPIETTKTTYINLLMGTEIAILLCTILITFIFKIKEKLLMTLKLILIFSLCLISIFGIEILHFNNMYNKEWFEEYYIANYKDIEQDNKKVSVGMGGIKITNSKDSYVSECLQAYKTFQIKVGFLFILFVAIIGLNIFLLIQTMNRQSKEERLRKDDIVVYDEEENVKF